MIRLRESRVGKAHLCDMTLPAAAILVSFLALLIAGCRAAPAPMTAVTAGSGSGSEPRVLAIETFLADIAQNVAGDRVKVEALIPIGVDPHNFEPAPSDVRKIADSDVLIVNGAGLESFLGRLLQNTGGQRQIIEASKGLSSRQPREAGAGSANEVDPHFWLDPVLAITYVENIRDGLIQADPAGRETYARGADSYIAKLRDLDAWIADQVKQIPPERRILVTNHEEFGYFADRYGFKIVGAIIPSITTGASPSARELADLAGKIKASGAPAIFLEVAANPQLADQLARETGVKVVTGLFTHSLTPPDGKAPDYIQMMRQNTTVIANALQ